MDEPHFGDPIGKQLRLLRFKRGVSLQVLADASGLACSELSRIERGRDVRWSTIVRILSALCYEVRLDARGDCDEGEGLLQDEIEARQERQRAGPGVVLPKRGWGEF